MEEVTRVLTLKLRNISNIPFVITSTEVQIYTIACSPIKASLFASKVPIVNQRSISTH